MVLNSIEGILFLSYFTDYNIGEIHNALKYETLDHYYNAESERLNSEIKNVGSLDSKIRTCIEEAQLAHQKNRYNKIYHIPFSSNRYPASLKLINQPPPMLYVKGKIQDVKCAAVIGTRNISMYGIKKTFKIVEKFLSYNYGIVSGLALGIDTYAHLAALEKKAYTIAVMAHSLESIYPKENYSLANRILDNDGALISELPTGINRGKKSFVERNRLQSGLSEFVVPVEMATSSGTMHTVNFCKAQKKKLILIKPIEGAEDFPQYEGINHLIDIQKKTKSEFVFVLDNDFDLSSIPHENNNASPQLELFS